MPRHAQPIRAALALAGGVAAILAAGFAFRWPAIVGLWPWADSRLSLLFVASICAANAAPILWIALTGAFRAAEAGALNLVASFGGSAIYLFQHYGRQGGGRVLGAAIVFALLALLALGIYAWSRRLPWPDARPTPGPVRAAFGFFTGALILAGVALVVQAPHVFPWPLDPRSSVIYGWIFLGAAVYFAHGVVAPRWPNAVGQLLGFLAYDLVLIGPFLAHFGGVAPAHRASLIVYTGVLIFSGALAVYYLGIHPATRFRPATVPIREVAPGRYPA